MRVIFLGFGTVGQGLAELIIEKRGELKRQYGFEPKIVGITDMMKGSCYAPDGVDLEKVMAIVNGGESLSTYPDGGCECDGPQMIERSDADAMVELTYTDITTGEPATSHVRAALQKGMHVVTSNKGPVALFYRELEELARAKGVKFLFEGTVMSGTPVLNMVRDTLAGSDIQEVRGILNGTTNYILTQMEAGQTYAEALKDAQELGYAEAVPDADVLGWDALAKVTILANVVFGADLKPSDSDCDGITEIAPEDMAAAATNQQRYKLIGRVWRDGDTVKGSVGPQLVDLTHPLAGVMGATNALTFTTDTVDDVTVVGPGAGRRETGYSILIDLLTLGR